MKLWVVNYLPAVGDDHFDSVWSSREKAEAYLATKYRATKAPRGHWDLFETTLDEEPKGFG